MMKRSSSGVKRKRMLEIRALMQTLLPLPVVPGYWCQNVDPFGPGSSRQIALERDDFVHPHSLGRVDFITRDRRSFGDVASSNGDAELPERFNQNLLHLFEFGQVGSTAAFG